MFSEKGKQSDREFSALLRGERHTPLAAATDDRKLT